MDYLTETWKPTFGGMYYTEVTIDRHLAQGPTQRRTNDKPRSPDSQSSALVLSFQDTKSRTTSWGHSRGQKSLEAWVSQEDTHSEYCWLTDRRNKGNGSSRCLVGFSPGRGDQEGLLSLWGPRPEHFWGRFGHLLWSHLSQMPPHLLSDAPTRPDHLSQTQEGSHHLT